MVSEFDPEAYYKKRLEEIAREIGVSSSEDDDEEEDEKEENKNIGDKYDYKEDKDGLFKKLLEEWRADISGTCSESENDSDNDEFPPPFSRKLDDVVVGYMCDDDGAATSKMPLSMSHESKKQRGIEGDGEFEEDEEENDGDDEKPPPLKKTTKAGTTSLDDVFDG